MKRGIAGTMVGVLAISVIVVATSNVPASALSLFGFEINLAEPAHIQQRPKSTNTTNNLAPTHGNNVQNPSDDGCLQYANHEYEVCVAYIFNASLADLSPYYKYIHSLDSSLASFVSYRL